MIKMPVEIHESTEHIFQGAGFEYRKANVVGQNKQVLILNELKGNSSSELFLQKQLDTFKELSSIENFPKPLEITNLENEKVLILESIDSKPLPQLLQNKTPTTMQALKMAVNLTKVIRQIHLNNYLVVHINPAFLLMDSLDYTFTFINTHFFFKGNVFSNASANSFELNSQFKELVYLSPELVDPACPKIDYRNDIFQIGNLLYEWLSGKKAFLSENPDKTINSFLQSEPPKLGSIVSDLSKQTEALVLKLLCKEPTKRYQDIVHLIADLQLCLEIESAKDDSDKTLTPNYSPQVLNPQVLRQLHLPEQKKLQHDQQKSMLGLNTHTHVHGESGSGKSQFIKSIQIQSNKNNGIFLYSCANEFIEIKPLGVFIQLVSHYNKYFSKSSNNEKQKKLFKQNLFANFSRFSELDSDLQNLFENSSLNVSILEIQKSQNSDYFQFLFLEFFRSLANRKTPLTIVIDNINSLSSNSHSLLLKLIADKNINYLHIITCAQKTFESYCYNQHKDEMKFNANQIRLRLPDKVQTYEWIQNTLGQKAKGLEALQNLIWNKCKGDMAKAKHFLFRLQQLGLISFSQDSRQYFFIPDNFQTTLIPDDAKQIAFCNLDELDELEKEVIFILAHIHDPISIIKLQWLLFQEINMENLGIILLKLNNKGHLNCELSSTGIKYSIQDKITAEAGKMLFETKIKLKKIFTLAVNTNSQKKQTSHWHATWLFLETMRCEFKDENPEQIKVAIQNIKKSILLLVFWGEFSKALEYCNLVFINSNHKDARNELQLLSILKFYLEKNTFLTENKPHQENKSATIESIDPGGFSDYNKLLFNFIEILVQTQPDKSILLCKAILKRNGVRIPRKINPFRVNFPTHKFLMAFSNKSWPSKEQEPEIEILQYILFLYSNLIESKNRNRRNALLIKAIEFGLKYNLKNELTSNALMLIATSLNNKPDHALRAVQFHDNRLSFGQYAKILLFRYIHCWSLPYQKWEQGFQKNIYIASQNFMPVQAGALALDDRLVQLFNSKTKINEQIQLVSDILNFLKQSKQEYKLSICLELKYFISVLAGSKEKKEQSYSSTRASSAYLNLLELATSLHLGENNSSSFIEETHEHGFNSTVPAFINHIIYFYEGLHWLTQYSSATKKNKLELRKKLAIILTKLQRHYEIQSDALPHRYLYIKTLLNSLNLGKTPASIEELDQIISLAKHNGCILDAALMCKVSGIMHLEQGSQSMARSYIQSAFELYNAIEANGICALLYKQYPEWVHKPSLSATNTIVTPSQPSSQFDDQLHTFYISINKLDTKSAYGQITKFFLTRGKANKAALFACSDSESLQLLSTATRSGEDVEEITSSSIEESRFFPHSILDSANRSQQEILLHNFEEDAGLYREDPYFSTNNIKSIFCFPILFQDNLLGLLYLEYKNESLDKKLIKQMQFLFGKEATAQTLHNLFTHARNLKTIQNSAFLLRNEKKLYQHSQEELKVLQQQLKGVDQKQISFLTGLSNKIRKPVKNIEKVISNKLTSYSEEVNFNLKQNVEELKSIISGIINYSQLEKQNQESEPKVFYLLDCLRNIIEKHSKEAANKNIEIIYELSANLPQRIIGEESQLSQILDYLLNNAVRFTHSGEIYIAVSASQDDVLHKIEFIIKDTGRGMSELEQQSLFKNSLDNTASAPVPSGLGLIIAKRLCQIMGGNIEVISELNKGSTFKFTIKALSVLTHIETKQNADIISGKKILLVDDNLTSRRIIRHSLRSWGSFPMAAISGKSALELIGNSENKFSMAIIDNDMPNMSGLQLANSIRNNKNTQHIAIILLINPLENLDDFKDSEHLIQKFIYKPVNLDKMQSIIIDLLLDEKARYADQKKDSVAQNLGIKRFD